MVQLYLDLLNKMTETDEGGAAGGRARVRKALKVFLAKNMDSLDKGITHGLLAGLGQADGEEFFCELTEDYERLITFHIIQGQVPPPPC